MSTILEAKKINKYFRKPVLFHVLKDISFEIKEGEFVSIMGKSGCGKSTLLYILSTMDTDYEGTLHLNGQKLTGKSGEELARIRNEQIGFVFQSPRLSSKRFTFLRKERPSLRKSLIVCLIFLISKFWVIVYFLPLSQGQHLILLLIRHDKKVKFCHK